MAEDQAWRADLTIPPRLADECEVISGSLLKKDCEGWREWRQTAFACSGFKGSKFRVYGKITPVTFSYLGQFGSFSNKLHYPTRIPISGVLYEAPPVHIAGSTPPVVLLAIEKAGFVPPISFRGAFRSHNFAKHRE